ncbi:MAG: hypothetical protein ACYTHM_02350 [Planctomycetota bacterium]
MFRSAWFSAALIVGIASAGGGGAAFFTQKLVPHKDAAPTGLEAVPGKRFVRFVAFGFDKALADILWLRTIQYFNNETLKPRDPVRKKGPLLKGMADAITELDPHFHGAYFYGAIFLRILRRHEEALDLLEEGMEKNPGVFIYPYELGNTCLFDLRDRPVSDPELRKKGIRTYRDLAVQHYKTALKCRTVPSFFVDFFRSLMSGRGEFDAVMKIFLRLYETAPTKSVKKYFEGQIRNLVAERSIRAVLLALLQVREAGKPPPAASALPALPGLETVPLKERGRLQRFTVFETAPFSAGPVKAFRDRILYDPNTGDALSLYWVKRADEKQRQSIEKAAGRYREKRGRFPAEGVEGIRELMEEGMLFRWPRFPLGGGYVVGEGGKARTELGWEKALAEMEGR